MENADDVEVLENSHQIQNRYTFWYRNAKASANYNESIKKIASFQSVEHFWRIYDYLKRPKDLHFTEYHLFKDGIFPTWEDPQNKAGGKWMIRLKKGISSRYWEDVILAIIGEQFDVGSEICGAVLSIRSNEDILSVWNKTADNLEAVNKIRDQLRRLLRLPNVIVIEYKRHQDSLVDKSSYRNPTMVWRAPARTTTDKPHGFSNYNAAPNKPAWKGRNAEEGVSGGTAPAGGTTSGYRGSTGNAWNKTASTGEAPAPVPRGRSDSQEGAHNTRVAGAGGWQRGQATGTTATPTGATTAAASGNVSSATAVLQGVMGLNKSKPAGAVAPPVAAAPVGNAWARKGPAI